MLPLKNKHIHPHPHDRNKESILTIKKQIKETRVTIRKKTNKKEKLSESLKKSFEKRLFRETHFTL